jgi:hypothetical protein
MLSLIATYALSPVVDRLVRWHVPRALAAALLLMSIGGAFGWTGYSLYGNAAELVDSLHLEGQTTATDIQRWSGNDLDAVPDRGCAAVFDADRRSDRCLICAEHSDCRPYRRSLHPRDQPRRPENRHVATAKSSGGVVVSDFTTHRATVRPTSINGLRLLRR